MTPFQVFCNYLALKSHFSNPKYDYFKYNKKVKVKEETFKKRKDIYWFQRTSRKYSDEEVVDYFLSNFVATDYPENLWIGEIIKNGEENYQEWKRRQQSLTYIFKEQSTQMLSENNLNELLDCSRQHPPILKMFLSGKIYIETLVIWNKIFTFENNFDNKLSDPVWETVSLKIKKYSPFIHINDNQYKKFLRDMING
jgi:hypothetical protein